MTDFAVGKKIFDNIVEYPLPKKQGVQDYIFYLVPGSDPFGENARSFFNKFYKSHKPKDVSSFEDIIDSLFAEVTQNGVKQVREIIIVAHGNALQLLHPLVKGSTPANLPKYIFLSAARMSALQQDFFDDKFPDYNTKRKAVITHLKDDSWITIRACNFGQNKDGLYAVYSFFGGQANVYAPAFYQQFAWMDIGDGSRFENKLVAHEHLVKQRIVHRGHTPDRKIAVVDALVDPAKYSVPVTLASKKSSDADSETAAAYQAFKTDLNNRNKSTLLKKELSDAQMQLSDGAWVTVVQKDANWIINDSIQLEASTFNIEYAVSEQEDSGTLHDQTVSVVAEARLKKEIKPGKKPKPLGDHFSFQLFIDEDQNKAYKGWLFFLTAYVEDTDKQPFDAITTSLNAGGPVPATISALFLSPYQLSGTASITVQKPGKTWLVNDTTSYVLKSQYAPSSDNKKFAHVIAVYVSEDDAAAFARQGELLATTTFGKSPNLPGTELLVYLDKFLLADLQSLIDYLRNPYQPENIIYLFHAINATWRKNQADHAQWIDSMTAIKEELNKNPLARNPYTELSMMEQQDYLLDVYEFDVNSYWKQVKALNASTKILPADLFSDEPLPAPEAFSDYDDAEADSPASSLNAAEALQVPGTEPYKELVKVTVDIPDLPEIDCPTYQQLLAKIKALNTTDEAAILEALGDEPVGGLKFRDYVMRGLTVLNFTVELSEGFEVFAHSSVKIASIFGHFVESAFFEVAAFALPMVEAIVLTLEIFEAEAEGAEIFEGIGKRVAARQWVNDLEERIVNKSIHFPGKIQLDKVARNDPNPAEYWVYRYQSEEMSEIHVAGTPALNTNIFDEDFHKGFDEGWEEIEEIGNEALNKAPEIFDAFLKRSNLSSCHVDALKNSGLIDMDQVSAVIMLKFIDLVRDKTPRTPQPEE